MFAAICVATEVVPLGAVMVTTFEALVALKPTTVQAPLSPAVQALILVTIAAAISVVVVMPAVPVPAERMRRPPTVTLVTDEAKPVTVMVAVRGTPENVVVVLVAPVTTGTGAVMVTTDPERLAL